MDVGHASTGNYKGSAVKGYFMSLSWSLMPFEWNAHSSMEP